MTGIRSGTTYFRAVGAISLFDDSYLLARAIEDKLYRNSQQSGTRPGQYVGLWPMSCTIYSYAQAFPGNAMS